MTQINLMALRHSAFYSPYLMMMAGGHLQQAGLDFTYTVQTPDNLVADRLLDGSCQVSQSAVAAGFTSLENNQPDTIRHFAQINARDGFFLAAREEAREEARAATRTPTQNFSWKDLVGKQVLVDHFFQPMAMFKYALFKQQINWQDIQVIDAGDVTQIDKTFRNGTGDFVHQQGPAPQQMQADGIATVVASVGEIIGPVAFSSLCANINWLQTDTAGIFFQLYKKALTQCQQSTSLDIARQLHDYGFLKEIELAVLDNTIKTYQQLGCWNHNGNIGLQEYEKLLDVFEYSQLIGRRFDFDELIYSLV